MEYTRAMHSYGAFYAPRSQMSLYRTLHSSSLKAFTRIHKLNTGYYYGSLYFNDDDLCGLSGMCQTMMETYSYVYRSRE